MSTFESRYAFGQFFVAHVNAGLFSVHRAMPSARQNEEPNSSRKAA